MSSSLHGRPVLVRANHMWARGLSIYGELPEGQKLVYHPDVVLDCRDTDPSREIV